MDIRTFLTLSPQERVGWVENIVIAQNPRLRKGEHMTGPVGAYKHGRTYVPRYETAEDFERQDVVTVQAKGYLLTNDNIGGHPFLDIVVQDRNYLHMYDVVPSCRLGVISAGDTVKMLYGQAQVDVVVTQQMIEDHTTFTARFALSK